MNNLSLILLVGENIFLLTALIIWWTRKCLTCQQVKTIEQIFTHTCHKCQKKPSLKPDKTKQQIEI